MKREHKNGLFTKVFCMSRLISLRQRIKTALTIKKTTHAMRLTSMSAHARLQRKKQFLRTYKQSLEGLMHRLGLEEKLTNKNLDPEAKELVIVIGSQKGLCGAFNSRLMSYFEQENAQALNQKKSDIVCVGKKILEYFEQRGTIPRHAYTTFNAQNFVAIAHELELLIFAEDGYHIIKIYSNHPHTFFIQKCIGTTIVRHRLQETIDAEHAGEYIYEQKPREFHEQLQRLYFKACLEDVLFNSLIAEQAARFISMDSATRNAETMLSDMQRDYNKLRQALITRELTDLAGGIL
jgi:F-type H+-transporting ATPase subunit gamma